jgi:energy-coupling factor transporter transmembrane protein EcfT
MDPLLIISIICGVALVFFIFLAKIALRWVVRVIIVGVLLLAAIGGVSWWWLNRSTPQSDSKPRQTSTRSANSNRR